MGLKNQGFSKPQISSGFTLIELMITVAIVGVLAALALPAYQDYTIRSQVVEGLSLASGSKSLVAEYYMLKGSLPTDSASVSYDSQSGKYVATTAIQNGEILAYFGNSANQNITGSYIKLVPDDNGNNLVWSCESNIVRKYLPSSCAVSSAGNGGGSTGGNTSGGSGSGGTGTGSGGNTGNGGTGNTGGDNSGGSTDPGTGTNPPDTTTGKTLTPEQSSKYPEVAAAYQRYFDSAGQVNQYNQQASTLQSQADAAAASGDNNLANQLRGQAQNASGQANNFSTQMQQALTQYSQAINVYEGRNNGTLPGDFPKAPTI